MHVILRINPKQETILGKRLGLMPIVRDEETEITIFEVDETTKSGRATFRELQEYGGKPLTIALENSAVISF